MAENNASSLNNYKIPGMRGPRNRQETEKAQDQKGTIRRLAGYFGNEIKVVILLLAVVLMVVLCSIYAPKLQSNAIDCISAGNFGGLTPILVIMLVLYLIHSLCTFLQSRSSAILSQRVVKRMREDLFDCIVNLPVGYLDSHSHGDIMSRMTNDVENISNTVSQSLSSLFSGFLTIIGTVVMMLSLCPQLAVLSCATVILTLVATKMLSKVMKVFFVKRQVLLGEINGTVEEMVGGYKTVVAYGRQEAVKASFEKTSDELTKAGIIAEILGGSMGPSS